jgi:hypothetical protein
MLSSADGSVVAELGSRPLKQIAFEVPMGKVGFQRPTLSATRAIPPMKVVPIDGRSKASLAASLKFLRDEEPEWITLTEAKTLFSPATDAYAFGEIDEIGKANLAARSGRS